MGDNHAYAFAIHKNKGALSGKENPHVHLVYSDRLIERDRDVPRELFCRQRTGYKKIELLQVQNAMSGIVKFVRLGRIW